MRVRGWGEWHRRLPLPACPPPRPPPTPHSDALRAFNAILHVIPLVVVASRKEADDVKELLGIAR